MPQAAFTEITQRVTKLNADFAALRASFERVMQANGPYLDMRPWRLHYLQHLLTQTQNLLTNARQLSTVVAGLLGHSDQLLRKYLVQQHRVVMSTVEAASGLIKAIKQRGNLA